MIRKFLFLTLVSVLVIQTVYSQSPAADVAKPIKPGEPVPLSDSIMLKVSRASTSSFTTVKLQGQPVVVVLDLDAGKNSATISYTLSANPKLAGIYLINGTQKIFPTAVIEDFPSWGSDNDKEAEVLDPLDKSGATNLNFQRKGSISLLFDLPAAQAKSPQTLSIKLRAVQPTDHQQSFIVTL